MFNKKGSALILAFWALIFLAVMGLSISRRVNAEISLARHYLGKARAKYAAVSGLFYAIDQLRQDQMNEESRRFDLVFNCGTVLRRHQRPEDIFTNIKIGEAAFSVGPFDDPDHIGMMDESAKININALTVNNYRVLAELLLLQGVDEDRAEIIAASVLDWKDADDNPVDEIRGAEQEHYQSLSSPYPCKNYFFETLQELTLVRGMTPEILQTIKPYITVYPHIGSLRVNFNTASRPVLLALAKLMTGSRTQTNEIDAESLVDKIIQQRAGADGQWGTADDEPVNISDLPLNGPERAIASALISVFSPVAEVVRVHVEGNDGATGIKVLLEAVIKTGALEVVSLRIQ